MYDFDKETLHDFVVETEENLQLFEESLLLFEKEPDNMEALNEAFRSVHTIKGLANYLGQEKIGRLAHLMETLLNRMRSDKSTVTPDVIEAELSAKDALVTLTHVVAENKEGDVDISKIVARLVALSPDGEEGNIEEEADKDVIEKEESADEKLQDFFIKAEENLQSFENNILLLAENPENLELASEAFRSIQATRELASTLGFEKITTLAHRMETLMELAHAGKIGINQNFIEGQFSAKDALGKLINSVVDGRGEDSVAEIAEIISTLDKIPLGTVEEKVSEAEIKTVSDSSHNEKAIEEHDFDEETLSDFTVETEENLQLFEKSLLLLEEEPDNVEAMNEAFRSIHTIKGLANYLGLEKIGSITHKMETPLDKVRAGDLKAGPSLIETELSAKDILVSLVQALVANKDDSIDISEINDRLDKVAAEENVVEASPAVTMAPVLEEPVLGKTVLESPLESPPASEENKAFSVPSDVHTLDSLEELDVSDDLIIEMLNIPGVGKVKTQALEDAGFTTVGALRGASKEELLKVKGINDLTAELILAEVTPFISQEGISTEYLPPPDPLAEVSTESFPIYEDTSFEAPEDTTDVQSPSDSQVMPSSPSSNEDSPPPDLRSEPSQEHSRVEDRVERTEKKEKAVEPAQEEAPPLAKPIIETQNISTEEKSIDEIILSPQQSPASKQTLRVDTEKVDSLIAGIGELVVNRSTFGQISNNFREVERMLKDAKNIDKNELKHLREARITLDQAVLELVRTVDELQGDVMRVRMVPVTDVFNKFPRLVRNLSKEMGKRIKLEISGGETELDKNVTEEIYNPLVHLLRNAIDHGIEFPENRIKSEKNTEGHIKLSAKHEGDKVVISIRDDGRGIDAEQIKRAAIKKGVISELDAAILTKKEIMNLIFHPGFSTADKVTDISGRGVGMDVVKKNVDKLRGTIEIKSEPGRFTEFNIILPLTLAIIQALLVKVGEEAYCIPITSVIETERTTGSEIETIENTEVIRLRDKVIPLLRLSDIFNIEVKDKEENPKFFAVIVTDGVKEAGIVVDSLIGESSIVIKPFEDAAMETEGISGATILGDGRVSLILDVSTLIQFALERKRTARITLKKSESASNVVIDNVQPF